MVSEDEYEGFSEAYTLRTLKRRVTRMRDLINNKEEVYEYNYTF